MPDQIPQASRLHAELNNLNAAISMLTTDGTVINNLTIMSDSEHGGNLSIVNPNPPVSDPNTLKDLAVELQKQADLIAQQLTDMGYT